MWEHFGFKRKKESDDLDKRIPVCKMCHSNVKYSGNTTNLRAPLKRHHPDKVMLMEDHKKLRRDPKQTMLDINGGCSHKFPSASSRSQKITESIAYFIHQDLRPYSVVENASFRHTVNAMEPPILFYSNPRTPHQSLHSQAERSGKGTRQSLSSQRAESCPNVRRLDLMHN